MSNWYLGKKSYRQAIQSWEQTFNSLHDSQIKISEISSQIEYIFQNQHFKKYSNTFVEEIIWIGSQARIFKDSLEIHKSVHTFLKEVNKILCKQNEFEIHLNSIIGITIPKIKKYIPLSKRQDKPDSALWLIRQHNMLKDSQIAKLVGITKNSVTSIRNKSYWNYNNLNPKDPVALNLFTQKDIMEALEKAERRIKREKKEKEKVKKSKEISNNE